VGEFELIRRYFAGASQARSDVALGIGDDCALLNPPRAGYQLALSIDTLVEGVHFLPGTAPEHLATRLLGAATSDLAAMGATPAWLSLALTLPQADSLWLEPFATALSERARELGLALIGGDTTRGPLTLTAQVHGWVEPERALKRSGARAGDCVLVSGTLGDSRGGLELQQRGQTDLPGAAYLLNRFFRPEPRLTLAHALAPWLSAAIDISDGLLSDLGHLATASGLGARVELDRLPLSNALSELVDQTTARHWALTGGEDFELCMTCAPENLNMCQQIAKEQSILLTAIGMMTETNGISVYLGDELQTLQVTGYDHFGGGI
jgi:thiamine-monophosphate kinase